MNSYRKWGLYTIGALLVCVALAIALLTSCSKDTGQLTSSGDSGVDLSMNNGVFGIYKDEDKDSSWSLEDAAAVITLNGNSAAAEGSGVGIAGNVVTISDAGMYVLSGSFTGQIVVDTDKENTVRLIFNGVDISCDTTAPVYAASADKVIITLAEGTQNTVTDGENYVFPDALTDEPNAAIFAKDDLSFNGSGSLTVSGNYNNAISTKDDLVICGGNYTLTAVNNGLRGKDSVSILAGTFDITAGGDGMKSSKEEDAEEGWVAIDGGTYTITTGGDGVQAETAVKISDCDMTITTAGGSDAVVSASADSCKAIKGGSNIIVAGGTFTIDSADDALHSNGDVDINGGVFDIHTGDDGVHADTTLTVTDGEINIHKSYEGLEGSIVNISGGTIVINASDDGINAAGGDSNEDDSGRPFGPDQFGGTDYNEINISGGHITIHADGDGIDSNGDVNMSGGTLLVHGPTSGGDGALDCDGTFTMTGGTIIAAGSSGMAETPDSSTSTQPTLSVYYSTVQQAGTTISLRDAEGSEIAAFTPDKVYGHVAISVAELASGSSYTLYSDSTQLCTVTLSGIVTHISSTGETVSGGMGMGGGGVQGGNAPGGGMPGGPGRN